MIRLLKMRIGTDEHGGSLILALAFLALFGVAIATLLTFSDTSMRTTEKLRAQRQRFYTLDGAAQVAINGMKAIAAMGVSGTATCPATATVNGVNPTVTCAGQTGGPPPAGSNIGVNTPTTTVLALGTSQTASDGVTFTSNDVMVVRGAVFSNSSVNYPKGEFDVSGTLTAQLGSGCSGLGLGTRVVTGTVNCAATATATDPGVTDTTYALPISVTPTAGTIPTCVGVTGTFSPGLYTNPASLSPCSKNVFTPGNYLFAFSNATPTWTVTSTVIGGTPKAQSCDSTQPGVAFIFAGRSNVVISNNATFIVCANPSTTSQQIALYGLGHAVTVVPTVLVGSIVFVNPANGMTLGGSSTTGAIKTVATAVPTASETVSTFTPAIPAGSTINRAVLRIRHYESGNAINVLPKVVLTTPTSTVLTANPTWCTLPCADYVSPDLSASLNSTGAIAGMTVAYSATISGFNKTANAVLDGIGLDVEYTPAPFAGETTSFCGSGASCSLISGNSTGATVTVIGTVYAPMARVNVTATTTPYSFSGGIIVRSLSIGHGAGVPQASTPVAISPVLPVTTSRNVLLTVSLPGVTTKLTYQVSFNDISSTGGTVTIQSWVVDR